MYALQFKACLLHEAALQPISLSYSSHTIPKSFQGLMEIYGSSTLDEGEILTMEVTVEDGGERPTNQPTNQPTAARAKEPAKGQPKVLSCRKTGAP